MIMQDMMRRQVWNVYIKKRVFYGESRCSLCIFGSIMQKNGKHFFKKDFMKLSLLYRKPNVKRYIQMKDAEIKLDVGHRSG